MNNKERKIFGDTLCSLKDNENLSENIIKYPKYLFRYKSLTIDSLTNIKNNKLKFDITNRYQLNGYHGKLFSLLHC